MLMGLTAPHPTPAIARAVLNLSAKPAPDPVVPTVTPAKAKQIAARVERVRKATAKMSVSARQKAASTRRAKLLKFVRAKGVVFTPLVADEFGVSQDTAMNDLRYLEDLGQIAMREIQRMKVYFVPAKGFGG